MPSEDSLVAQLRSLVAADLTPYYDTHFNLLRWIQAFPDDTIEKVAHKLRHHLLFRASAWNIDSILSKKSDDHPFHAHWPIVNVGRSGVIPNCIVLVEQPGHIDYVGIFERFSIVDIVKAKLRDAEATLATMMEMEKETGQQASIIMVVDAEGIDYTSKALIDLVRGPMTTLSGFLLQHYVELLHSIVVVNVPSWASAVWSMVRPLLPERSRSKLRILSSSTWRDEIVSYMDPAICPSFWCDKTHKSFTNKMERPPRFERFKIEKPIKDKLDKLQLKAGQVHWMEYKLEKGDALSFNISGNSTFGFTIVHAEKEQEEDVYGMKALHPLFTSINGPLKIPIEDSLIAPHSGLYKVWFSNERAWWSSITIQHSIKVSRNSS